MVAVGGAMKPQSSRRRLTAIHQIKPHFAMSVRSIGSTDAERWASVRARKASKTPVGTFLAVLDLGGRLDPAEGGRLRAMLPPDCPVELRETIHIHKTGLLILRAVPSSPLFIVVRPEIQPPCWPVRQHHPCPPEQRDGQVEHPRPGRADSLRRQGRDCPTLAGHPFALFPTHRRICPI